jgi:hypothetical protein
LFQFVFNLIAPQLSNLRQRNRCQSTLSCSPNRNRKSSNWLSAKREKAKPSELHKYRHEPSINMRHDCSRRIIPRKKCFLWEIARLTVQRALSSVLLYKFHPRAIEIESTSASSHGFSIVAQQHDLQQEALRDLMGKKTRESRKFPRGSLS